MINPVSIPVGCRLCGHITALTVEAKALESWAHGALAQDAFPELCADIRELLISNTCSECFDAMLNEEDE